MDMFIKLQDLYVCCAKLYELDKWVTIIYRVISTLFNEILVGLNNYMLYFFWNKKKMYENWKWLKILWSIFLL